MSVPVICIRGPAAAVAGIRNIGSGPGSGASGFESDRRHPAHSEPGGGTGNLRWRAIATQAITITRRLSPSPSHGGGVGL